MAWSGWPAAQHAGGAEWEWIEGGGTSRIAGSEPCGAGGVPSLFAVRSIFFQVALNEARDPHPAILSGLLRLAAK